jgi:hypothetical protein
MITLVMPSAFRDLITGGNAAAQTLLSSPEAVAEAAPMLLFAWFVLLVVGSLIMVVLARTIVLGRGAAMIGGAQALMRRGLRVVLKSLSALFVILIYALPSFVLVGLIADHSSSTINVILAVLLILWVIAVAAAVVAAFYAAVLSESIDRPSGILKGWEALKGKRVDLAGAVLIIWLVFLLSLSIIEPVAVFGGGLIFGEAAGNVLGFVVTTALSGIVSFVLMAATFSVLGVTAPRLLAAATVAPIGDPRDN